MLASPNTAEKKMVEAIYLDKLFAAYHELNSSPTPENTRKLLLAFWDTVSQERFPLTPQLFEQLSTLLSERTNHTLCGPVIQDFVASHMPIFLEYLRKLSEGTSPTGLAALQRWVTESDLWGKLEEVLLRYPDAQQSFVTWVDTHSTSSRYNVTWHDPEELDSPSEFEADWNPRMQIFAKAPFEPLEDIRARLKK